MSKKEKSTLIITIIAVLLLGVIVASSTFAYFQWSGSRTNVSVRIPAGDGAEMIITPSTTSFTGLKPTNDCDGTSAMYGDALVKIENGTGTSMIPSFKLKAKVTKGGSEALTSTALGHIHYAVVSIQTSTSGVKQGTLTGSCDAPLSADATGLFTNSTTSATGNFSTVSTSGAWTDLPTTSAQFLPRQYNAITGAASGVTFKAPQYATTYQWYRVYVWIDETYTTTTIGNVVSDPLQNAKIELTWSENSMLQQVAN